MAQGPQIIVEFLADTAKLARGASQIQGTGGKIKSAAKGIGLAIGGAFAVSQVVNFTKAAAEDEAQQVKLAQTIKNTTHATDAQVTANEAYISTLSKQVGISDDELRPAMSNLVRGTGDVTQAQKELALATDISAGTGKDLSSVSQALMKAHSGNVGALGRLGIKTKDAEGKTKSLKTILGELGGTFKGQAAKSADTAAGKMKQAQVAFGEMQETIGKALLPVVEALAPVLEAVAGFLQDNAKWVVPLVAGIWLLNAALAANPVVLIAIGIAALVAGFIILYQKVQWFRDGVQAVWSWIKRNWPLLVAILTGPIGVAVLLIIKNWDKIKRAAKVVFDFLKGVWNAVVDFFKAVPGRIGDFLRSVWDKVKDGVKAAVQWIKDRWNGFVDFIKGIPGRIGGVISRIVEVFKGPINALIRAWNAIEFRVPPIKLPGPLPDFPGFTLGLPNIPELAKGGILTSPTLFLGGEGPGREIVAPESLLRELLAEHGGNSYTLNIYPKRADASEVAFGFRRLELLRGGR